jgi:hypothetical protein
LSEEAPSRDGFWRDECGPQCEVQWGGYNIRDALEALGDAKHVTPTEVWNEVARKFAADADKALMGLYTALCGADPEWCENDGGHWTDSDEHKVCTVEEEPELWREQMRHGIAFGSQYEAEEA